MPRNTMLKASEIVGDYVRNAAGEKLGKIQDLIIDPVNESAPYAIVSFDGTPAAGTRLHAVPLSALRPSLSGDHLVFEGDRAIIERAPAFDGSNWPDMTDPSWESRIHGSYPPASLVGRRPREIRARKPVSLIGAVLSVILLVCLLGFTYLVATRGWESARDTVTNWAQGVAYAAKETSEDAALTAKVKTALYLSRRVGASAINVDTQNEVVTLRGEVPDQATRDLAEVIARDTPGVTELHNDITINPSALAEAEMERIRGRVADLEEKYLVHDAIVKQPALAGQSITVEVGNHRATLSGVVDSADQKYLAEQIAASIEGVTGVDNQLRVRSE